MYEYMIPVDKDHPRKGEGDLIVLKDGSLLLAYTEFYGCSSDFSPARIVGIKSYDNGYSWSKPFILQENIGQCNVMSVSLVRLKTGEIAFFYGVKNSFEDLRFYMRKSFDEGETWSKPVLVTVDKGYFVMNNDRVVQLSSGRIIAPVSTYQDSVNHSYWKSYIYYSDDNGETWVKSKNEVKLPKNIDSLTGLQEPGIIELKDNRIMMYMRTGLGYIYASYSEDWGETWSKPKSLNVKAPTSPSSIKRIPQTGDLILIWNDKNNFNIENLKRRGADICDRIFQHRAPLSLAISRDEGETWIKKMDIEPDLNHRYCYTSITFKKQYIFLTYYYDLNLKIKRIDIEEIYR